MFDWNDEELTNILWGESGENDDHIVPYPGQTEGKPPVLFGDQSKKEANHDTSNSTEQKKSTVKAEHEVQIGSCSGYDISSSGRGFSLSPWPDANSSDAEKVDRESMGANNRMKGSKNDGSLRDEEAEFDKDSELFQNQPEESEEGHFVDYEWANIGSFDDLDRIFSNNDPIFGDMGVGNADELWTSSKDLTSSPTPLVHKDLNENTSHIPQDAQAAEMDGRFEACPKELKVVTAGTVRPEKLCSYGQGNRQKRSLKRQASGKNTEVTRAPYWSPFQQVNSHYPLPMVNQCPQFLPPPQTQLQRPELLQQRHFSGPLLVSPFYGNMVNHYPAAPPVLTQFHEVPPGPSNANSFQKSFEAATKPPAMSPKEKIEKLRRRQQLRAISAIQRQRQQFGDQVLVDESHSSFPSLDSSSPIEPDDANTNCMGLDNFSVEESVLYRLQDTISKLDTRVSLCIRDSLFRLAKSAMRRRCPNDTSSSIDEGLSSKDINDHKSFTSMADIETDTNPIDRVVAHLLFHRPAEFPGKPAETPESPLSMNLLHEQNGNSSKTSANAYFTESLENSQLSPQGSKTNGRFSGSTSIPGLGLSNNDNADGGCKIVEDSK